MGLGSTLLLVSAALVSVRAGNTTCKTTSLDWYTQSVGETPCRTYERLRQNCNAQYQVGNFGPSPPGDQCTDQVSTCCCNSVAFALSMLCQNCQYGIGSSLNGDHGFDAAPGTYGIYRGNCGAGTNKTLPKITQQAVCRQGINIPSYLYTLFWGDGAWFYEYTKGTAQLEIQSGQNVTNFCDSPSSTTGTNSISSPTTTSSQIPSNSDDSSGPNVGAIAGGVVGGVGLLVIAALVFWFSRRRRSGGTVDLVEEKEENMTTEPYVPYPPAPQPPSGPAPYPAPSSYTYTYPSTGTSTSSDALSSPAYIPPPPPPPQSRRTKSGMVASGPPTRDEIGQSSLAPVSSIYSSDRHEDSAELSQTYGIARSASGRLPPTYQER